MKINGFDPLSITQADGSLIGMSEHIMEGVIKGSVLNILKSYTGFFDVFSEAIQNSLDATERRAREEGATYRPKIFIKIDTKEQILLVSDNGCGMDDQQFLYCFSPSVSFKKGQNLRGNKGVGATFLAYGYNFALLKSKTGGSAYAALLRNGRSWAEDSTNKVPRPTFEEMEFGDSFLTGEKSGTTLEIRLTQGGSEKPKDFAWHGAQNADQWSDILRIVTPLGGIYLTQSPYAVDVKVEVVDRGGNVTAKEIGQPNYYYPHDIPNLKVQDLASIRAKVDSFTGDPKTVATKLPDSFKNLDCIYEVWDTDRLLSEKVIEKLALSAERLILLQKHNVSVYGCHVTSVKTFDAFNEGLGLRSGIQFLRGGLQLATDHMPQGDQLIIPLKRYTGYQRNTHIVVHFSNGNPDLGRKTFQPELRELAEDISEALTNTFISYRQLLKADTGSIVQLSPSKDLHNWKGVQEAWRNKHPLVLGSISPNLTYASIPQEEQDVISLFHQLVGAGVLRGIHFFGSSIHDTYDALVEIKYENSSYVFDRQNTPLGVHREIDFPYESDPKVLEYKYDLDAIFRDFEKQVKFIRQVDLVVCWKASLDVEPNMVIQPMLVDGAGDSRIFYGSTHRALQAGSSHTDFEIIVLEDLINYLKDPSEEIARQKVVYQKYT